MIKHEKDENYEHGACTARARASLKPEPQERAKNKVALLLVWSKGERERRIVTALSLSTL